MSKRKPLIILGADSYAEIANYYFTNDSIYEVIGFSLDNDYISEDSFIDLPIISTEDILKKYVTSKYEIFIAIGYSKLNKNRRDKFNFFKKQGYKLASYISSNATILSKEPIEDNCFILENNTIQPFVKIGKNVVLWSGNHIGHHSIIHNHTFIASQVVISGSVEIGEETFIGVNSTISDHVKIGDRCLLGAGALITKDTLNDTVYIPESTKCSKIPSYKLFK